MAAITDTTNSSSFTLNSVRHSLIRQEDTIIFALIERSKFPLNSPTYDPNFFPNISDSSSTSLLEYYVKEIESVQSKVGRYESPEEHPFFPDNLPPSIIPPHNFPQILYPAANSININKAIWDMYINQLLPLLVHVGDDGKYASTAASDFDCLQALSRRIHYGKFVAEVKFRAAPEDYKPAILTQDRDAIMNLLTFPSVEEMVKQRVEKKTMVFGQDVTLNGTTDSKYKVDPLVVGRLYEDWVMPLTKEVQVEYLLRRLD